MRKVISILIVTLFAVSGISVGSIHMMPQQQQHMQNVYVPQPEIRGYKTIYYTDFTSLDWIVYLEQDVSDSGPWRLTSGKYVSWPYSAFATRKSGNTGTVATGMYKLIDIPENWIDIKVSFKARVFAGGWGTVYIKFYVNGERTNPLWVAGKVSGAQNNFDWKSFTFNIDSSVYRIEFYWYAYTCKNDPHFKGAWVDDVHVYGIPPPPNKLPIEQPNDLN
jgi:hypothetical protein